MMLLDVVVMCMLAVTSVYCWRLNGKISSFRSAKEEMDHVIRSFDSSIRQAYESIAILKKAGTNENISLIRDMKRLQYLANDLAMLVEKGEKIAVELESSVRKPAAAADSAPARRAAAPRAEEKPVFTPPRRAAKRAQPKPEPTAAELAEVKELVDTLARSYVVEETSASYRPAPQRPQQQPLPQYQPQPQPAAQPRPVQARPADMGAAKKESKVRAIEKMLSHMSAQSQSGNVSMPSIPPRDLLRKAAPEAEVAPAAAKPETRRFFDSLRVITPNE